MIQIITTSIIRIILLLTFIIYGIKQKFTKDYTIILIITTILFTTIDILRITLEI